MLALHLGLSMKLKSLLFILFVAPLLAHSQETFPVNGVHDSRHTVHAFTNATIYVSSENRLDSAMLVIQDGVVLEVSKSAKPPKNASGA